MDKAAYIAIGGVLGFLFFLLFVLVGVILEIVFKTTLKTADDVEAIKKRLDKLEGKQ